MLSQRLLGNLEEGWLQPTLAALFQDWWYLIVLSVLVSTVLLWMAGQLIKTDMELRRAVRAMAQGGGREEAVQNIAYFGPGAGPSSGRSCFSRWFCSSPPIRC